MVKEENLEMQALVLAAVLVKALKFSVHFTSQLHITLKEQETVQILLALVSKIGALQ
jgi:hypothetical protein